MLSYLYYLIGNSSRKIGHLKRSLGKPPPYVLITLHGEYRDLPPQREGLIRSLLQRPAPSIRDITRDLKRIGHDPRIKGVILRLYPLEISRAGIQTLHQTLLDLQDKGKEIITWAPSYDLTSYYLALAANTITLQEGGEISSLGLKRRFLYLKKGLEHIGLKFHLLPISPYKSAGDRFTEESMTEESKAMEEWLLESTQEEYSKAIMEGRGVDKKRALEIIDRSPYIDSLALEEGLIDKILSQEDLPSLVKREKIVPLKEALKKIYHLPLSYPRKGVTLLRVEGMIVDGESKRPPLSSPIPIPLLLSPRAGDMTLVRAIRMATSDRNCKAVVLYIDSGGGSASASESMTAALRGLAEKKPLVVAMGSTAASGGYYIATPAHHIVAHPLTITGSIGVLGGKVVDQGLIEKLLFHREILTKGESALFNDSSRPYTEEEEEWLWKKIQRTYTLFLKRVSTGRAMAIEDVDTMSKGRVWTGRQALEKGLVDALGGLEEAIEKAKELAHLPMRAPLREMPLLKGEVSPSGETQALLDYMKEGLDFYQRGQALCLLPFLEERRTLRR